MVVSSFLQTSVMSYAPALRAEATMLPLMYSLALAMISLQVILIRTTSLGGVL